MTQVRTLAACKRRLLHELKPVADTIDWPVSAVLLAPQIEDKSVGHLRQS